MQEKTNQEKKIDLTTGEILDVQVTAPEYAAYIYKLGGLLQCLKCEIIVLIVKKGTASLPVSCCGQPMNVFLPKDLRLASSRPESLGDR